MAEITILRPRSNHRFTPLPEQGECRKEEATMESIEHWSTRVLDAQNPDQVQMIDSRAKGAADHG